MRIIFLFFLIIQGIFFSGCLKKVSFYRNAQKQFLGHSFTERISSYSKKISLSSIKNINGASGWISKKLYEELFAHFVHEGYHIFDTDTDYTLAIELLEYAPEYKYISSDILLYHAEYCLRFSVFLQENKSGKVIAELENYKICSMLSRKLNSLTQEEADLAQYSYSLKKDVVFIEQYFRPFLS